MFSILHFPAVNRVHSPSQSPFQRSPLPSFSTFKVSGQTLAQVLQGEMLFPCRLPLSDFMHFCISFLNISQSLFLSHCLEKVLPHGNTPAREFLLYYPHFFVASARWDERWVLHKLKRAKFPLTLPGSNLHPQGPIGRNGRAFPFSQRICNPLIVLKTSNIFFRGQSSYLISDECSGWASSAAGKPLEVT